MAAGNTALQLIGSAPIIDESIMIDWLVITALDSGSTLMAACSRKLIIPDGVEDCQTQNSHCGMHSIA